MISSQLFIDRLRSMRVNQADFQPRLVCYALNHGMDVEQSEIAETLHTHNKNHSVEFFDSMANPVYKVLSSKNMIRRSVKGWEINTKLNKVEKEIAMQICKAKLKEAEKYK